ncbi:hypothetical protein CEXT_49771 [Caerostris extrusa]|uniref:Uncharacterized protein n=1 Tax=Caerostris extrusa TaxID=172846 RepID=A0AAV4XCY3_CAEEX|nr:hypothetical protein CEXT_49771 [Caerostris extrusa]
MSRSGAYSRLDKRKDEEKEKKNAGVLEEVENVLLSAAFLSIFKRLFKGYPFHNDHGRGEILFPFVISSSRKFLLLIYSTNPSTDLYRFNKCVVSQQTE